MLERLCSCGCGKPIPSDRALNVLYLNRQHRDRESQRRENKRLIEKGICVSCKECPAQDGMQSCRACREKVRVYLKERTAARKKADYSGVYWRFNPTTFLHHYGESSEIRNRSRSYEYKNTIEVAHIEGVDNYYTRNILELELGRDTAYANPNGDHKLEKRLDSPKLRRDMFYFFKKNNAIFNEGALDLLGLQDVALRTLVRQKERERLGCK